MVVEALSKDQFPFLGSRGVCATTNDRSTRTDVYNACSGPSLECHARLMVNMIARGKYDRAGEDIPYGKELSPNLLKYVDNGNGYAEEIQQQRTEARNASNGTSARLPSEAMSKW